MADPKPRRWIAFVYAILLTLTVPWYWPQADVRIVAGFPLWVLVVLSAVLATSVFTAWVYLSGADDD